MIPSHLEIMALDLVHTYQLSCGAKSVEKVETGKKGECLKVLKIFLYGLLFLTLFAVIGSQ